MPYCVELIERRIEKDSEEMQVQTEQERNQDKILGKWVLGQRSTNKL